jgi:hypothetical protein
MRPTFLQRPLPPALNCDLAINAKHSFWTVQKDAASLNMLPPTTRDVGSDRTLTY